MKRALVVSLIAAPLIALGAVGWIYSGQILGPDAPPSPTGQAVLGHTDSTITLAATPKARRAGDWAIEWPGGYGRIGPLIETGEERVTTRFRIAHGTPPDSTARLTGFAPDANPRTWLGLDYDDVSIPARVGPLPAWLVPGTDSTWVVLLHGRAATRAEVLRMIPAYRSLGLPCLVVAYRNDPGAPRAHGGGYRMGATEWEDLEDAVRWARGRGARDVVVMGCSMGGGIVAQFLRRSSERAVTRAAVLDAPALDWNVVLAVAARQRRVPAAFTEVGKLVASLRSGLRWSDLVQVLHAGEFSTPMLIVHGDHDDMVPLEVSERFAGALPDLVTMHVFPGAGHVESSNVDPESYAEVLASWLSAHGIGTAIPD